MTNLSQDLLHELFYYKDGNLFNKISRSNFALKDKEVGWISDKNVGYKCVTISSQKYKLHRLIWIFHNGNISTGFQLDHINGNRIDNHIENLRLVTHQENQWNRVSAKGYYWREKQKRFISQIRVNNEQRHLGSFHNEQEARQAYINAKKELHIIQQH
jgi:hypothetical protein